MQTLEHRFLIQPLNISELLENSIIPFFTLNKKLFFVVLFVLVSLHQFASGADTFVVHIAYFLLFQQQIISFYLVFQIEFLPRNSWNIYCLVTVTFSFVVYKFVIEKNMSNEVGHQELTYTKYFVYLFIYHK